MGASVVVLVVVVGAFVVAGRVPVAPFECDELLLQPAIAHAATSTTLTPHRLRTPPRLGAARCPPVGARARAINRARALVSSAVPPVPGHARATHA